MINYYRCKLVFKNTWLFTLLLMMLGLLGSCGTMKYLDDGEAFLVKNKVVFEDAKKLKEKKQLLYELQYYVKQKPNTNLFGIPFISRRYFYYRYQKKIDENKVKDGKVNNRGEKPSIFDEKLAYGSAESMKNYLANRGFFNADVYHLTNRIGRKNKKVKITYVVNPNNRYYIDTIKFISEDSLILKELEDNVKESLLQPGMPVDNKLYEEEVRRIYTYFRNRGYAKFYPNYIGQLEGDSTNFQVKIDLNVSLPANEVAHKRYYIRDVIVYPVNKSEEILDEVYKDTIINGVTFRHKNSKPSPIKFSTLLSSLYIGAGDLYNQSLIDKSNTSLERLGFYKFVNISTLDAIGRTDSLDVIIRLNPKKKHDLRYFAELNTSNLTLVTNSQRLLGAGVGTTFRNKNLLGGAELLVLDFDLNFDLNLSSKSSSMSLVNSLDLSFQSNLYLPKFVDYFSLWSGLKRLRLISNNFYNRLSETSSTNLTAGVNYTDRFGFYRLLGMNASFGYEIPPTRKLRYNIKHFGMDFLKPSFEEGILEIFETNPFLERSFDKQFFTGILMRNIGMSYTRNTNSLGVTTLFRGNLELSGLEVLGANKLYNTISNKDIEFVINKGEDETTFSQFVVLDGELRIYKKISDFHNIAFRAYASIGSPYGYSEDVPYVKQFFVGGPNSIRAWSARELGPGGYIDSLTFGENPNRLNFYQTGDFKIEANIEYRFKLFKIAGFQWNGAIFADIGNVYTIKEDPDRPLSKLAWRPRYRRNEDNILVKYQENFLKQLAVGTGFGLRADFSYFILRFDMGFPLRNPYLTESYNDHNELVKALYWRPASHYKLNNFLFNLGLGYSF